VSDISDRLEELATKQGHLLSNLESLDSDIRANFRAPSKASSIGYGRSPWASDDTEGAFISALFDARSQDFDTQREGKAALEALGSHYSEGNPASKATLGDSAGAGGNIVPPNVLSSIVAIATAGNPYRQLLNVQNAGFVSGVDVPVEASNLTRAVVAGYGATKANENFTTSKYSATMYTIARIIDVGNQLLRNSKGAAENLVVSRLGRAFALGEAYYILSGSGSSEPKGLLTSLAASDAVNTTNKGAATTSPATSIAGTVVAGIKALALRNITPTGVVLDPTSFWTAMTDASTSFSVLGAMSAEGPVSVGPDGGLRIFGLRFFADPNMPLNTGVIGDWSQATLFTGQTYRVDVSDQAGTRWDSNETGFRGEEEIAFNADPYVQITSRFQRLTGLNT
jgi:HK97 family phage major capsid protein